MEVSVHYKETGRDRSFAVRMGRRLVYVTSDCHTCLAISVPTTKGMPLWGVKTPQPNKEIRSDFGGIKSEIATKKCLIRRSTAAKVRGPCIVVEGRHLLGLVGSGRGKRSARERPQ